MSSYLSLPVTYILRNLCLAEHNTTSFILDVSQSHLTPRSYENISLDIFGYKAAKDVVLQLKTSHFLYFILHEGPRVYLEMVESIKII